MLELDSATKAIVANEDVLRKEIAAITAEIEKMRRYDRQRRANYYFPDRGRGNIVAYALRRRNGMAVP